MLPLVERRGTTESLKLGNCPFQCLSTSQMKVQPRDVTIKGTKGNRHGVTSPECPSNLPIIKSCLLPSEGYRHGSNHAAACSQYSQGKCEVLTQPLPFLRFSFTVFLGTHSGAIVLNMSCSSIFWVAYTCLTSVLCYQTLSFGPPTYPPLTE